MIRFERAGKEEKEKGNDLVEEKRRDRYIDRRYVGSLAEIEKKVYKKRIRDEKMKVTVRLFFYCQLI